MKHFIIILLSFLVFSCAKNDSIESCNIEQNRVYRVYTDSSFNSLQQGTIEFLNGQFAQTFNNNTTHGSYEQLECSIKFNPTSPIPSIYNIIYCSKCDLYLKVTSGAISDKCLKL